ncbi:MAG: beta-lactamase family protein [Marinicaulis sp.]|nr:beta-lactamase family protein [Marinicaulis sp.]
MKYISTFFAALSIAVSGCYANDVGEPEDRNLQGLAASLDFVITPLEAEGASGVVFVTNGDQEAYARAFGFADCANKIPMTLNHVISIGSITKELVNVAAFGLVDESVIFWDDAVSKWIADWPAEKAITIRQLSTHTSGLPDIVDENGAPIPFTPEYDFAPVTREEMIDRARASKLLFEPGTQERYSNLGFALYAAILENAVGQPIEGILRKRIFEPAGMMQTGYVVPDWTMSNFAEGCRADRSRWGSPLPDGRWMEDGPGWNLRGNGGLYSTARDMARYMGGLGAKKFLSDAADQSWRDKRLVFVKSANARGFGPAGGNGITNTVIFWLEEDADGNDLRVVIMTTDASHQAESFASDIIRSAFDVFRPIEEPAP